MKVLYLDLGMGAAGDMLTAALLELLPDRETFITELNSIGLPDVTITAEASVKCGIQGTHISVIILGVEEGEDHTHSDHRHEHTHNHDHDYNDNHDHDHHHHASLHDVEHIISKLRVSERVKADALAVYQLIAEAESQAHGKPVTEIHFHEVGTMDAIADVTAVCMLMERLAPDRVVASPVHVGSGHVHCAHGVMPVPAPAAAYILQGIPTYGGGVKGELCTPTGAALLKYYVDAFGDQPVMRVNAIGYGMGKKDFSAANCVRAMIGDAGDEAETVYELSCNIDDMTAERIGFAMERLMEAGAKDVYTVPIGMKKSRPGTIIRVICTDDLKQELVQLMFRYTSTLGIRESKMVRYYLDRCDTLIETSYGVVRRKDCSGYGVSRSKYEYDDLAAIAAAQEIGIDDVIRRLENK